MMTGNKTNKDKDKDKDPYGLNKKWSKELLTPGYTMLPSIILEKQAALGLDPIDINILLQLSRHWWTSENPPFPSKETIAKCIGRSKSTVQRHIAQMEANGFIKREERFDKNRGQQSNKYLFDGLIKIATPYAKEHYDLKIKSQNENNDRKKRKRPKPVSENAC